MLVADQASYPRHITWPIRPDLPNPLADRLSRFVELDQEEIDALGRLSRRTRKFRVNETLVDQQSNPNTVCLMLTGVAYRYRFLSDGRRQIFGYLLAGDLCDTEFLISNHCDHSVGLLCDSEVAMIPTLKLMEMMVAYPRIERALLTAATVETAIMREWLLNMGQRDAIQKLAHFLCEMSARLGSISDVDSDGSFAIPITQIELADTIGLTPVHVNRSLQRLRRQGVLCWSRRRLTIINRQVLELIADFDDTYLRLRPEQSVPKLCAYG